jgi:hypothetical protein
MTVVETPQAICQFGLARCDITPPVGIYHRMWGAAAHDRATGVHRPLTATAMVFRDPDTGNVSPECEQVLVAVDHCLLWAPEMTELLDSVCRQTGIAREQIAVNFSHTHASGLMDKTRQHLPGGELIPGYLGALAENIARIVGEARARLEQAILTVGTGRCPLAANRDFPEPATGQFVCGFNPAGPTDDTALVARLTSDDGQLLAVLVNYACHPTTLAWDNTLISPDFPGGMRELVENAIASPCVFIQGASGDLGPREGFVGNPEVADRNGWQLGHAVFAAMETLPPPLTRFVYQGARVSGATIGTWAHEPLDESSLKELSRWRIRRFTVELPYRSELRSLDDVNKELASWQDRERSARASGDLAETADCRAMVERMTRWRTRIEVLPPGKTFPFPVVLWQTGKVVWVSVEGELYNVFQRTLRQRFDGHALVIATLMNGSRCCYLPTAESYGKGIYQESIAVLAPGCLEELMEKVAERIEEMLRG